MKIGIDFDNTLVCYDRAFALVGKEEGLLPPDFSGGKEAVKARLLDERPDGYLWEKLQGLVYGRRIDRAELFEGVADFFLACGGARDKSIYIVSHKTVLAHHDPLRTNLRDSALAFMAAQGFFDRLNLARERVFFEGTREEKVRRIGALGLDVFVDDIADVLTHAEMPKACRKILFRGAEKAALERADNWHEIRHAILGRS